MDGIDGIDARRETLRRVVREPEWQPKVASPEGKVLEELAAIGWVTLETVADAYSHTVTERGLDRHRTWGDDRRQGPR